MNYSAVLAGPRKHHKAESKMQVGSIVGTFDLTALNVIYVFQLKIYLCVHHFH